MRMINKDNESIRLHLFKKVINLYFCRDKKCLNAEIIIFLAKNYYIQCFFEYFPSIREFFQFDLQPNRLSLCFLGIKLGVGFHKVIFVNENYCVVDDYIQFHIDSGAVEIINDDPQDEVLSTPEFDWITEFNLCKIYSLKIIFKQTDLDEREWLGFHLNINFRKKLPNILLKLCVMGYELAFFANKKAEKPYIFSYPKQINELGHTFKKLNLLSAKQINPNNIMIVGITSMGGMGYAGTARLFVLDNREIKLYFAELSDNKIVDGVKTIFPPIEYIYPRKIGLTKKYNKGWRKIGMGAGNLLMVRTELFYDIQKELKGNRTCKNPTYFYKNWCKAAYLTLQKNFTRKE